MNAQTTTSPVGEYYLRGVMETASGFKLNADSTFDFFFSYGALDRSGKGHWRVEKDTVVFDSKPPSEQGFTLLSSGKHPGATISVQVKGDASMRRYFHCKISGGGKVQEAATNEKGVAVFRPQPVEAIELFFEFCPDKKAHFVVKEKANNNFVFAPKPSLMEVVFQNFRLHLTDDGMQGGHPLSTETSFRYEKQR